MSNALYPVDEKDKRIAELEAQCGALREALEEWLKLTGADRLWSAEEIAAKSEEDPIKKYWCAVQNAKQLLASTDAGKALLEWKESASNALGLWYEARELIGGALVGDGPMEWAQRVKARVEKAEEMLHGFIKQSSQTVTMTAEYLELAAMKERAEKAERALDEVRSSRDALTANETKYWEPRVAGLKKAVEEMREQCAKYLDDCGLDGAGFAESIRALPLEPNEESATSAEPEEET